MTIFRAGLFLLMLVLFSVAGFAQTGGATGDNDKKPYSSNGERIY
jgi:hypothetical protein